jgi:hypothetical protein
MLLSESDNIVMDVDWPCRMLVVFRKSIPVFTARDVVVTCLDFGRFFNEIY